MQDMMFPVAAPSATPVVKPGAVVVGSKTGADFQGAILKSNMDADAFKFVADLEIPLPTATPIAVPQSVDEFEFGSAVIDKVETPEIAQVEVPLEPVALNPIPQETPELDDKIAQMMAELDAISAGTTIDANKAQTPEPTPLPLPQWTTVAPIGGAVSISTATQTVTAHKVPSPQPKLDARPDLPGVDTPLPPKMPVQSVAETLSQPAFSHDAQSDKQAPVLNIFADDLGPDSIATTDRNGVTTGAELKQNAAMQPPLPVITPPPVTVDALALALNSTLNTAPVTAHGVEMAAPQSMRAEIAPMAAQTGPVSQTAQPVMSQVAAAISQTTSQDIEIRLDPEELGKLRIVMTPKDGGYDVMIFADRDQTLELLRRNASDFTDQFEAMGFEGSTLDFASSGGDADGDNQPAEQQNIQIPADIHSALRAMMPGEGLDIRY